MASVAGYKEEWAPVFVNGLVGRVQHGLLSGDDPFGSLGPQVSEKNDPHNGRRKRTCRLGSVVTGY